MKEFLYLQATIILGIVWVVFISLTFSHFNSPIEYDDQQIHLRDLHREKGNPFSFKVRTINVEDIDHEVGYKRNVLMFRTRDGRKWYLGGQLFKKEDLTSLINKIEKYQ